MLKCLLKALKKQGLLFEKYQKLDDLCQQRNNRKPRATAWGFCVYDERR